ncbi:MAG: hypothetical protein K9N06_06000 [Candidatus Cloacimonetes bacterium]|nr:hypothetical protein [Candidatus Cloacimonadota bacterium]
MSAGSKRKDFVPDFRDNDAFLKQEAQRVIKERKELGMENLVGNLEAVIINTEPGNQKPAVQEFLDHTGYDFAYAYEEKSFITAVLTLSGSADILMRSRKKTENPFREFNLHPSSKHLPDTRLETFVFSCQDVAKYFEIQKNRGVSFLESSENDNYIFLQTRPSLYTGVAVGLLQWFKKKNSYLTPECKMLDWKFIKPAREYLKNIGKLDHTATRVKAEERDAAIIEFMELTNYNFDLAIYVKSLNSITNVARLSAPDFAMVFTSGIAPFKSLEESGPTEKFIYNYGARTHHLAFITQNIEETYRFLGYDGLQYLIELIGSPDQGLKQTFTVASSHTLLVNEYIYRYGDFTGFFTKENVTLLTEATEKQ